MASRVLAPRYSAGVQVRVHHGTRLGHRRVPDYIHGITGQIERYCGAFKNPEELAYGFDGLPACHLYRVRFRQTDIWSDYAGPSDDTLDLEVPEHWLSAPDRQ